MVLALSCYATSREVFVDVLIMFLVLSCPIVGFLFNFNFNNF